jgi:hypothetical protein
LATPGAHSASAQHLNDRKFRTYGHDDGGGFAFAALPMRTARNFMQKIGTFSA